MAVGQRNRKVFLLEEREEEMGRVGDERHIRNEKLCLQENLSC